MDKLKHKVHSAYKVRTPRASRPPDVPRHPATASVRAREIPSSEKTTMDEMKRRAARQAARAVRPVGPRTRSSIHPSIARLRVSLLTHALSLSVVVASQGVAEQLMPAMTKSAFAEKGVVTPEEFIVAGDFLVSQARSIHWSPYDRVGVVDADP